MKEAMSRFKNFIFHPRTIKLSLAFGASYLYLKRHQISNFFEREYGDYDKVYSRRSKLLTEVTQLPSEYDFSQANLANIFEQEYERYKNLTFDLNTVENYKTYKEVVELTNAALQGK
jgi:hypothetical protein